MRKAVTPGTTDWGRIVGLYDLLLRLEPSPVVELNRAVAAAMRDGPQAGLEIIDTLIDRGACSYHLLHSGPGRTSSGGWGRRTLHGNPTSKPWIWPVWNRKGASLNEGLRELG